MTSLAWEKAGELPTIPPPPGVTPNFVDPVSLRKYDNLTQSVCLTLATLFVCMRIWTKSIVLHSLGWDDYTALVAWLGLIATGILNLEEDRFGNGRHLWDVKGNDFSEYAKLVNVSQILYCPVIFTVKLSIILLFLRVFAPIRATYLLFQFIIWANFLFYTAGVFVETFRCNPRNKIWYPLIPGTCVNERVVQLTSGVFNTLSDFAILIVPMISVWDLNLPTNKKVGLLAIFGTGLLGCVASLVRMVIIIQKGHYVIDGTWEWYSLNLWSTAEITCGILCGCLPPLPAFIRYIRGRQFTQIPSENPYTRKASLPAPNAKFIGKDDDWEELAALG